jgi:hypothetical protein
MRKVIVAFIAGQLTQLVCHAVCVNFWWEYQMPFCIAGGFLVTVAVLAGVWVAKHSTDPVAPKNYREWAQVPGGRK